ncbi:glycosyltransferase [Flavitalea flava]
MVILLDCRPFQYDNANGEGTHFIISCINNLSIKQDIEWIFLVDNNYCEGSLPGLSGGQIITRRAFPGKAGWKLWYGWQIERVAKKYKADLVMTTGGRRAAGLSFPQCLWIPVAAGPETGRNIGKQGTVNNRKGSRIEGAGAILAFFEKDKEALTGFDPGRDPGRDEKMLNGKATGTNDAGKVFVISCAADEDCFPASAAEKETIKNSHSGGKEYFFSLAGPGAEEKVGLLKSFSLFKKRQKSNMQLILAGPGIPQDKNFLKKLETYKYREDVHLYDQLVSDQLSREEVARLLGGAYAFIYPFIPANLGIPLLNAWKSEVPVITQSFGRAQETGGEAVLYAQPGNPSSLADLMMTLYKDENRRNMLIEKGKARLKLFSLEQSADQVWEAIQFARQQFLNK